MNEQMRSFGLSKFLIWSLMELAVIKKESTLGATLLVTGCCVGAGMLGLPVVSSQAGLIPTTFAMLLCCLFAIGTGLLLLEAVLWFDQKVNLLSIVDFAMGKYGKLLTGGLYLFLYYCLFVAYIDGGGQLLTNLFSGIFGTATREQGIASCLLIIIFFSCAGTQISELANRLLMAGLIVTFFVLISLGLPQIEVANLKHIKWTATFGTMPILLVCFGYQNLVPTLVSYLRRDVKKIRNCIVIGNLLPFALYFVWNLVILGLATSSETLKSKEMAEELLEKASLSDSVVIFMKTFSLLAIFTSIIPNAISFIDFLEDGFKGISLSKLSKQLLVLGLFLVPPTLFSLSTPHLFLQALSFAGAFADVLLLGILPATVVWIGRYKMHIKSDYRVRGGKIFIVAIVILSGFFILTRGSI